MYSIKTLSYNVTWPTNQERFLKELNRILYTEGLQCQSVLSYSTKESEILFMRIASLKAGNVLIERAMLSDLVDAYHRVKEDTTKLYIDLLGVLEEHSTIIQIPKVMVNALCASLQDTATKDEAPVFVAFIKYCTSIGLIGSFHGL